MSRRLDSAALEGLPAACRRPAYDRSQLEPGIVHLGVGAFHRAHQAVYTDDALEAAGGDWGTVGISLRSPTAASQLNPQDGLFCVGSRDGDVESLRVVGNIRTVITAPDDPAAARAALANPRIKLVTLTITEKGYCLDPASGELLFGHDDLRHAGDPARTPENAISYLVDAIRTRRKAGTAPFTIISCDNLPANGTRLHSALTQYAALSDEALAHYIDSEVACPQTMVDRIVPATTSDDLERIESLLGCRDAGYVKTEPFSQWVIEDRFSGPIPAWDRAHAMIVPAVGPFENAKLRLLNGPHSSIAYLGYLAGFEYVHEVMAEPKLARYVADLMDMEILPMVDPPPGLELAAYARELRRRFENHALQHRCWQIAMDGSQKLPQRLLNTIRRCIRGGRSYERLALAVAGWLVYASGTDLAGRAIDVRDPLAERMREFGEAAKGDPAQLVRNFLSLEEVFGEDLMADRAFAGKLEARTRELLTEGVLAALGKHA
ncbi:MAG: mannitol dehydrogenase family protein [Pseudomonadota bacterium]